MPRRRPCQWQIRDPELNEEAPGQQRFLRGMLGGDIAEPAGQHDRLVVAAIAVFKVRVAAQFDAPIRC